MEVVQYYQFIISPTFKSLIRDSTAFFFPYWTYLPVFTSWPCSMGDLFRDTAAGNLIRLVTRNRLLQYPEEIPGFEFPYPIDDSSSDSMEKPVDLPKVPATISQNYDETEANTTSKGTACHEDIEQGHNITPPQPTASQVIHPVKTKDAIILVDWYSTGRSSISSSHWTGKY